MARRAVRGSRGAAAVWYGGPRRDRGGDVLRPGNETISLFAPARTAGGARWTGRYSSSTCTGCFITGSCSIAAKPMRRASSPGPRLARTHPFRSATKIGAVRYYPNHWYHHADRRLSIARPASAVRKMPVARRAVPARLLAGGTRFHYGFQERRADRRGRNDATDAGHRQRAPLHRSLGLGGSLQDLAGRPPTDSQLRAAGGLHRPAGDGTRGNAAF